MPHIKTKEPIRIKHLDCIFCGKVVSGTVVAFCINANFDNHLGVCVECADKTDGIEMYLALQERI